MLTIALVLLVVLVCLFTKATKKDSLWLWLWLWWWCWCWCWCWVLLLVVVLLLLLLLLLLLVLGLVQVQGGGGGGARRGDDACSSWTFAVHKRVQDMLCVVNLALLASQHIVFRN